MFKFKSPLPPFFLTLLLITLLAIIGPQEKSLGTNVRIVYLHGAWVLTAELGFLLAAVTGLLGIVLRRESLQRWSAALGRTGICFWITYLPLSLLTMQANWNGLFLAEPRFRVALTFAVTGLLLQAGLWLLNKAVVTSIANFAFFLALRLVLSGAAYVMHPPPSPIFTSGSLAAIGSFVGLNLLAWAAGYWLTRIFLRAAR